VTSGALVLAVLDAIGPVIWYSMLQALPAEGGADGRCRRSMAGAGEQPAGQCDIGGAVSIGEETVVTDAVATVGQHMDQEAADELVDISCQLNNCREECVV
jgi:hypothetical protein